MLTKTGDEVLERKSLDFLYETISENILAFGDIYELLSTTKETQSEQDVLEYIKENFDIDWTTFAQANFRLLWLINLNKIEKTPNGYRAK